MFRKTPFFLFAAVLFLTCWVFSASDWPQWQGPERTNLSLETGLLRQWPSEGPPKAWEISTLGEGYGTVSVVGERIYIQGTRGGSSVVFALNRSDGKEVWTKALGPSLQQDRGKGPRGTPTVDGERLFALSENGDLACLKAADGAVVWQRNILKDFNASNPKWLISESPLVDGDRLVVTPGGPGAGMVALDKTTGKTIWTSKDLSDPAAYSSCIVADIDGIRTYMTLTSQAGVGVRASDGKLMWRYEQVSNRTANITTPIFHNNRVFYTTDYGTGCAVLELKAVGDSVEAREVYFNKDLRNHHGGVVLKDGYLYGYSSTILTCMEFDTGKVMWRDRSVGKGSLTYADGHLYLVGEGQMVGLAEATPEGYKEKGRFKIADQGWPSWAHPVVIGGRLYVRNWGLLTAYDIKAR